MRKIDLASQAQAFRIMSIIKQIWPFPILHFSSGEQRTCALLYDSLSGLYLSKGRGGGGGGRRRPGREGKVWLPGEMK